MHIDHDYNMNAAKGAKEAGSQHYGLMSAYNANPKSWFTYMKCKGQIEEDLKALDFTSLSIFKPGLLNRGSMYRLNERVFSWFSYAIPVEAVARTMRIAAGEREKCVRGIEELESTETNPHWKEYYNKDMK